MLFLFAIAHQCCLLRYGCVHLSKQQQFLLARLCLNFIDACPSRICRGDFVGLRVVDSSSNGPRYISFVCNTTPICEGPFFPVRGLEFQQALLLHIMGGDLAEYCIACCLMLPYVAKICIDNCVS